MHWVPWSQLLKVILVVTVSFGVARLLVSLAPGVLTIPVVLLKVSNQTTLLLFVVLFRVRDLVNTLLLIIGPIILAIIARLLPSAWHRICQLGFKLRVKEDLCLWVDVVLVVVLSVKMCSLIQKKKFTTWWIASKKDELRLLLQQQGNFWGFWSFMDDGHDSLPGHEDF